MVVVLSRRTLETIAVLLTTAMVLSAAGLASAEERPSPSGAAPQGASAASVDRTEPTPKQLRDVGVTERLGAQLPQGLSYLDEAGKAVSLGQYLGRGVPVILTLNYSNCPMLCSLQLTGLVRSLKQLKWTAGREFRMVTVSLDPKEGPDTARRTKHRYVTQYGRSEAADGWHFLTGTQANIRKLANSLGFHYAYDEKRGEYAHTAAIALADPNGRIVRYLYGIEIEPSTLRLSLLEASQGKARSTVDRLILYCFHYDETEGRYAPIALNIMRVGGAVAVAGLAGLLVAFWMAEFRKRRRIAAESAS